jgi:hypothetical protein
MIKDIVMGTYVAVLVAMYAAVLCPVYWVMGRR